MPEAVKYAKAESPEAERRRVEEAFEGLKRDLEHEIRGAAGGMGASSAGAEIVRRIVGFAHNADFETISNPDLRGSLEQRSLSLAREMIVTPEHFPTLEDDEHPALT